MKRTLFFVTNLSPAWKDFLSNLPRQIHVCSSFALILILFLSSKGTQRRKNQSVLCVLSSRVMVAKNLFHSSYVAHRMPPIAADCLLHTLLFPSSAVRQVWKDPCFLRVSEVSLPCSSYHGIIVRSTLTHTFDFKFIDPDSKLWRPDCNFVLFIHKWMETSMEQCIIVLKLTETWLEVI